MDRLTTQLPAVAAAPGVVRGWLRDALHAWSMESASAVMELLATEIVTNVVQHVHQPMTVRIMRDGSVLRLEVDDASPVLPACYPPDPTDDHHRGMFIVESLSSHWGATSHSDDGKTVWFELDLAGFGSDGAASRDVND